MKNLYYSALAVFVALGCTAEFRPGDRDSYEDAPEGLEDEGGTDTWTEAEDEPGDTVSDDREDPEPSCGTPEGDCDSDGVSPASGDCCDDERMAYPGQAGWFGVPYYCPDEVWDYNCNGTVDYEYRAMTDGPVHCGDYGPGDCEDYYGWRDGLPECGTIARFVRCYYSSYYGCGQRTDYYEGLVRCR
jgi:hypothetical protein